MSAVPRRIPRNAGEVRPQPSRDFSKFWRALSQTARTEFQFYWLLARLWRLGPHRAAEFVGLFVDAHGLRQPFEAAIRQYLDDDHPPSTGPP